MGHRAFKALRLQDGATATGNGTILDITNAEDGAYTHITVQVEGISGDTITFEGTVDDDTYYALRGLNLNTGTVGTTATADGLYAFPAIAGLLKFRARISTYGSGTITATAIALQCGTDLGAIRDVFPAS